MFCVIGPAGGRIDGIATAFHINAAGDGEGMGVVGIHEAALDSGVDAEAAGEIAAGEGGVKGRRGIEATGEYGWCGYDSAEGGDVGGQGMVEGEAEGGGQV